MSELLVYLLLWLLSLLLPGDEVRGVVAEV